MKSKNMSIWLMSFKYFISILLIVVFATRSSGQIDVGLSLGMNFENLDTPGNNEFALNTQFGNIGFQLGLNGAIKLSKNFSLMLDIYYVPKKEIPFSIPVFSDLGEYYSYQTIKSSLSFAYSFKNLTFGAGPSFSKFYDRRLRFLNEGWRPSKNCTMIGGVFTIAYRFKKFYFNGKYRVERHSRLPRVCTGIAGVRTIEFGLGYFITKEHPSSKKK